MTDYLGLTLCIIALVLVCLPCRYDPAIRLREWLDAMDTEGPPDD